MDNNVAILFYMRWFVFGLTYVAYTVLYSTRKPFSVVKLALQDDLGVSTEWLGWIDTGFLAAYAFGQILLPVLLCSGHRASILLGLYLGAGLLTIIFSYSSNPVQFMLIFICNGLVHSAVFPMLCSIVSPYFASVERGSVMGAWTTSQQVGATIATLTAAYLNQNYTWRHAFRIPGIATIIFALGFRYTLEKSYLARDISLNEIELTECRGNTDLEASTPLPINIWAIPDFRLVGAAYFCVKCVRYSLMFWLPYYLASQLGFGEDTAGYASIMFDIGGLFGGLIIGRCSDTLFLGKRLQTAAVSSFIASIFLIVFVFCRSTMPTLVAMTAIGFAIAGCDSIIGGSAPADLCERYKVPNFQLPAASGW